MCSKAVGLQPSTNTKNSILTKSGFLRGVASTLKNIFASRDTVTVHFSDERGNALYYLTMYRRADPDNAWLIERAQMEELFSFYCDLDTSDSNAMYLVYDMIGHPNIYWLKNGRAFRLYVYFGEYEPDMSQESILELSQVELLRAGT